MTADISVSALEKQMSYQFSLKEPENLEETIKLADRIISIDEKHIEAYTAAISSYIILDDQEMALSYADRLLAFRPDDAEPLALKALLCNALYNETKEGRYLAEVAKVIGHSAKVADNNPGKVLCIADHNSALSEIRYEELERGLAADPGNLVLLYRKGLKLVEYFEDGLDDDGKFLSLVEVTRRMQDIHPEEQMTETLIKEAYNALGGRQRVYRKAIGRSDLAMKNIVRLMR